MTLCGRIAITALFSAFWTTSAKPQIAAYDAGGPIVTTACGEIQGKVLNTPKGQCDAYFGVPFAAPPVGDLRWSKPQTPACWTGLKNATAFGPKCVQVGSNATDPQLESEDCLHLNIFVPKSTNGTEKLPVMVFIHGGAFIMGSAAEYGAEGPCENLALRGVIVVTIQYRLFVYGFFSTGDATAPGNFGIWDQVEALKWINKNVASFGGDPNKVTIFGESAGGASVSYLTYAPAAKDFFQRSIAQSGSALALWASLSDASVASARKVADAAKCTAQETKEFVNCLRRLSTLDLQKVYNSVFATGGIDLEWFKIWAARADGELFTEKGFQELNTGKPVVIGVDTMELPIPDERTCPTAKLVFNKTLDSAFNSTNTRKDEILKNLARYVYLDSKGDRTDDKFVCQQLAKLQPHLFFHAPAAKEASIKAASGSPVWVYNFDFWSDNVFEANFTFEKGAPHAHELCYLFLMKVPDYIRGFLTCPQQYDGKYREVADYMGEMWTNFAKKGDPSPHGLTWPNFHNISNASAMTMRATLSIEPHFYLDIANFWNNLKPDIEKAFANGTVKQY